MSGSHKQIATGVGTTVRSLDQKSLSIGATGIEHSSVWITYYKYSRLCGTTMKNVAGVESP